MFEIIPKTFFYDFVARRLFWARFSFIVTILSFILFLVPGPRWSIDFTGGTEVDVHFAQPTQIKEIRDVLNELDIADDAVQQFGDPLENRYSVRLQGASSASPEDVEKVKSALTTAMGPDWIEEFKVDSEVGSRAAVSYKGEPIAFDRIQKAVAGLPGVTVQSSPEDNTFYVRLPGIAEGIGSALSKGLPDRGMEVERADSVGPKVGGNLRAAGITAIVVSTLLHLVYIGFRFDFTFAPGAIACLIHDVILTTGIMVLARQEFGLSTVSALLTLTGYSLNDTIVTYDRIRENMEKYRRKNFGDLINDSINQTLSRTIMTNGATALAMGPFLFWGGPQLRQFALVMLIGIVAGTYSSIYVAAPLTMILREHEPTIRRWLGLATTATEPVKGARK